MFVVAFVVSSPIQSSMAFQNRQLNSSQSPQLRLHVEEALGRARAPEGMEELTGLTLDSFPLRTPTPEPSKVNPQCLCSQHAKRTAVPAFTLKVRRPQNRAVKERAPTREPPPPPLLPLTPSKVKGETARVVQASCFRRLCFLVSRWFACLAWSLRVPVCTFIPSPGFWVPSFIRPKGAEPMTEHFCQAYPGGSGVGMTIFSVSRFRLRQHQHFPGRPCWSSSVMWRCGVSWTLRISTADAVRAQLLYHVQQVRLPPRSRRSSVFSLPTTTFPSCCRGKPHL